MTTEQRKELVEFTLIMAREFPAAGLGELADICLALIRQAGRYHRLAVDECNRKLTVREQNSIEQIPETIRTLCKQLGAEPIVGGDPRGCTVKLKVPSGRTNDFGQEGICVPQ